MRRAAHQPEPVHAAARGPLLGHLGTEPGRTIDGAGQRGARPGQRFPGPGAADGQSRLRHSGQTHPRPQSGSLLIQQFTTEMSLQLHNIH